MTGTTRSDFGHDTEGIEVAKQFANVIAGKTILITGANKGGISYSTARPIVLQGPKQLILAGRNPSKVQECIDQLKKDNPDVKYLPLTVDLSSQKSVRSAAQEVLGWENVPEIDIIFNSAGVMGVQERVLSEDGIEMHFATNHIGHFLLACLLMPKVIKAAEKNPKGTTRIVNVTSLSPTVSSMRWSDINFDTTNKDLPESEQPAYEWMTAWGFLTAKDEAYVPLDGYNRSKVANVLFSIALNKRLFEKYSIVSAAVHPGILSTELGRNWPEETRTTVMKMVRSGDFTMKSFEAGSATGLVAALDPKMGVEAGQTVDGSENWGSFLMDCQISGKASALSTSSEEADKLWKLSEKLVNETFEF